MYENKQQQQTAVLAAVDGHIDRFAAELTADADR